MFCGDESVSDVLLIWIAKKEKRFGFGRDRSWVFIIIQAMVNSSCAAHAEYVTCSQYEVSVNNVLSDDSFLDLWMSWRAMTGLHFRS